MTPSQPAHTGSGGITGLVRNLVKADSLDDLSDHTLEYFKQTVSAVESDGPLTELVVFRTLEQERFRVYTADGPDSERFLDNDFLEEDWPRDVWESLASGKQIEDVRLNPGWLGADPDDLRTVYLQSVPFKVTNDLLGFYLIMGSNSFTLPDTFQFLSSEFGEIVGEMLRYKQNSWSVKQRLNTFETLDHFYQGINEVQSLEEILKFCLETFQELFDASDGSVMIYDRDRDELTVRHSSSELTGDPMVFDLGEGVSGTALAEDELISLPNVKQSRYFKEFNEDELQLKSLLSIPLRTPRGPVGVVNLSDHEEHRQFEPEKIPGLEIMRSRVAAGLESVIMTEKLERVANTDELTGIYNRRYVNNHLESLFEEFYQTRTPFAVVLLDLDDFKSINDEHGHQTGDRVLKAFASELEKHARPRDLVGRFGGDEFIYVMPRTNAEQAETQGDYLAVELTKLTVDAASGDTLQPTASLGLSTVDTDHSPENLEELIQSADRRLYRAKEEEGVQLEIGGNQ